MARLIVDDGFDRSWTAHLEGPAGADVAFSDSDPLAAEVSRHLGDPAAFAPAASWSAAATDDVAIAVTAAQVAAAGPGDYRLRVWVTSAGRPWLAVDEELRIRALSANVARLALEKSAFARHGPPLKLVGVERHVGAECEELSPAISGALAAMGLPPADFAEPGDADLARVPSYALGQLHELLELKTYELILSRWDGFDFAAGSENSQKLGDLRKSIQETLKQKRAEVAARYIPGATIPDPTVTSPADSGRLVRGRVRLGAYFGTGRGGR